MRPVLLLAALASSAFPLLDGPGAASAQAPDEPLFPDPFPSTYEPLPSEPVLIRNATILRGDGERIDGGSLLLRDGVIEAVGTDVAAPAGVRVIEADGRWVTPGLIDTHSHLGNYPSPGIASQADGNELTDPNTAQVWAEHAVWPNDPGFGHAVAGGVTTLQVLPGSGNLFGGRGVTLRNVPSRTYQGMKFPGAPHGLKMACGENPKRVYGSRDEFPASAMANVAGYRMGWIDASGYLEEWRDWRRAGGDPDERPERDLRMESLAAVLNGDVLVHNHCYRGDEMATMIDVADEFGYEVASFHHAVEAYKIRDHLAENGICASMWGGGNWGFKLEAYDGIPENVALVHQAGGCAIVHSDSGHEIQRLNQHAAQSLAAAWRRGLDIGPEDAIGWITLNPARALGVAGETGSLEVGKRADVVLWSGDPFSVYTRTERVFVDGAVVYDRGAPDPHLFGDFMHGIVIEEAGR